MTVLPKHCQIWLGTRTNVPTCRHIAKSMIFPASKKSTRYIDYSDMIKLATLIAYNFCRYLKNKILYGSRFSSCLIQRWSPWCNIKLYSHATSHFGHNIEISAGCDFKILGSGHLSIGDTTYFNRYCMISAHGNVEIGKNCMFGPGVKIFDNNHVFNKNGVSTNLKIGSIHIGNNCWIGSNVVLLKGAHIGNNCVIGAGCTISDHIPDGSLVKQSHHTTIESIH